MNPDKINEHENEIRRRIERGLSVGYALKASGKSMDDRCNTIIEEYGQEFPELLGYNITVTPDKYKSNLFNLRVRVSIWREKDATE